MRISGDCVLPLLQRVELLPQDACESRARRFSASLELGESIGHLNVDVLLWPERRSYTGQPSAELHLIGSPPLLDAVVERLIAAGARAARAGEFTMRAFLAGRMDLPQAEAVLGVIDAEDPRTLDRALSQLAGNLSRPLQAARNELLDLLADVEAGLDFVDEDIEFIDDVDLLARLGQLSQLLRSTTAQLRERSAAQTAFELVLRGLPNAGKSCLLNVLSHTQSAIVTDQAGTTRDVITVDVAIDGHSIRMTDTAGIEWRADHEPNSAVLAKAQSQATDAASRADVCLWCIDASGSNPSAALENLNRARSSQGEYKKSIEHWVVLTKSDLISSSPTWVSAVDKLGIPVLVVSATTSSGMDALRTQVAAAAARHDANEMGGVMGTAARCGDSLTAASLAISRAIDLTQSQSGHELVAAEIRVAATAVGDVTGEVYTDDLLDRVFNRFCIGK